MAAHFDGVAEATGAFKKFFQNRNWLVALPLLAGQLVAALPVGFLVFAWYVVIIAQVVAHPDRPPELHYFVAFAVALAFFFLFVIVAVTFAYAWALAAAEPVWAGADPALERGFRRASAAFLQLIVFQILIALLSIASLVIVIGPIIVAILAIYGPPYIVLGGRTATQAIGDSFKLASENLGETLILVMAFIVVGASVLVTLPLWIFVPLGPIAIACIFRSYVVLAVVRFYGLLSPRAGAPPIPIVPETTV